jgi:hypothetical protein
MVHNKTLVGRWESRGRKYWIELFDNGDGTFSYTEDNGGGYMAQISRTNAFAEIERTVADMKEIDNITLKRVK